MAGNTSAVACFQVVHLLVLMGRLLLLRNRTRLVYHHAHTLDELDQLSYEYDAQVAIALHYLKNIYTADSSLTLSPWREDQLTAVSSKQERTHGARSLGKAILSPPLLVNAQRADSIQMNFEVAKSRGMYDVILRNTTNGIWRHGAP